MNGDATTVAAADRGHALKLFGICRGLGASAAKPGFTDWLASQIDDVAGLPDDARPLRFGYLWTGRTDVAIAAPVDQVVDLRMISTCLSYCRPYELPWSARTFLYDPQTWATLFPDYVMTALLAPPPPADLASRRREEEFAAAHSPSLRRLPARPEHLPFIVATRMSLSLPLLRFHCGPSTAVPNCPTGRRSSICGSATAGCAATSRCTEFASRSLAAPELPTGATRMPSYHRLRTFVTAGGSSVLGQLPGVRCATGGKGVLTGIAGCVVADGNIGEHEAEVSRRFGSCSVDSWCTLAS